jgi:hypothetical protein
MIIELWERLRGYDKWVLAEATIVSAELAEVNVVAVPTARNLKRNPNAASMKEWRSRCAIVWKNAQGHQLGGDYEVSDNSPLFQLYEGQTVSIRFDPGNPREFYLRGVLESRMVSIFKWVLMSVLGVLFTVSLLFADWLLR